MFPRLMFFIKPHIHVLNSVHLAVMSEANRKSSKVLTASVVLLLIIPAATDTANSQLSFYLLMIPSETPRTQMTTLELQNFPRSKSLGAKESSQMQGGVLG